MDRGGLHGGGGVDWLLLDRCIRLLRGSLHWGGGGSLGGTSTSKLGHQVVQLIEINGLGPGGGDFLDPGGLKGAEEEQSRKKERKCQKKEEEGKEGDEIGRAIVSDVLRNCETRA